MITVFDNMIVMKDKDGHAGVWDTIDKLGELLDMHGIKHAFAYPHPATIEANSVSAFIGVWCSRSIYKL